jgi:hypothetical protein
VKIVVSFFLFMMREISRLDWENVGAFHLSGQVAHKSLNRQMNTTIGITL